MVKLGKMMWNEIVKRELEAGEKDRIEVHRIAPRRQVTLMEIRTRMAPLCSALTLASSAFLIARKSRHAKRFSSGERSR